MMMSSSLMLLLYITNIPARYHDFCYFYCFIIVNFWELQNFYFRLKHKIKKQVEPLGLQQKQESPASPFLLLSQLPYFLNMIKQPRIREHSRKASNPKTDRKRHLKETRNNTGSSEKLKIYM